MSKVYRNKTAFYATFSDSNCKTFYATEAEAVAYIKNKDNDTVDIYGARYPLRYMKFLPQTAVRVDDMVYSSGSNSFMSEFSAIPCEWELVENN